MTMDTKLEAAVERLLKQAKMLGADGADAACVDRKSLSASVRLGKLEGVESEESRSAGLRVLIGKKQAAASTSDFSDAALDALADRVVAMAKAAAEDRQSLPPIKLIWACGTRPNQTSPSWKSAPWRVKKEL
jgi:PmbA protein